VPSSYPQHFAENPYFSNKVLSKSFVFREEGADVHGTEIEWKDTPVRLSWLRANTNLPTPPAGMDCGVRADPQTSWHPRAHARIRLGPHAG
jgi:hypothetical protein